MSNRSPGNSTNVRLALDRDLAPALIAFALWAALVGLMQASGALASLAGEVRWLTAFACAVAALAYAVDAELRRALRNRRVIAGAVGVAAALASLLDTAAMLAMSPAAVVCALSLAAPARARLSSAAAASPGARPGAL